MSIGLPGATMRIAVTGATGLVGAALVTALRADGHEVWRLERTPDDAAYDVLWRSADADFRFAPTARWDAVVHLAGAPVAEKRWTDAAKRAIADTRGAMTRRLVTALAALPEPPSVFISASAVGFYGDGGDTVLGEASPSGGGFLAEVCRDWEAAAAEARAAGMRVVSLRIGVVLAAEGGMLARLVPIYRWGGGGRVGDGRQWLSWIHRADLLTLLRQCLTDDRLSGPINAVSPQPVRQADFAAALGHALHRPALVPTPAFAVRLAFGALADEVLLAGQRVVPERLQALGFAWRYPDLASALAAALC